MLSLPQQLLHKTDIMKVSIIGAGAMGGSIARGLLSQSATCEGVQDASPVSISVSNLSSAKLAPLAAMGARVTTSNVEAVDNLPDVVIFCVKPWLVERVINELKPHIDYARTEVAVVAAGIPLSTLAAWLAKDSTPQLPHYCISMPNTAVSQCRSMTFQVDGPEACPLTLSLFERLGAAMVIEEKQLPAATSLASCGIAYAMRYVRAAMEGGVELGFRASAAQEIIVQTLLGTAALLSQPGAHPETEIDKVTTPGGITIRGLNAMEQNGFTHAVIAGLKASTLGN